ncbi:amidohydrolase family protein [Streptomyces abikoensis]|uniref:amidohydrolase family protein n=1 Tax=Streptomyces abikoensis TaxID=97398 RepID=UPI003404E913
MLITAARILTGHPGEVIEDGAVLISGETIVAAGPRAQVEAQASAGEPRLECPGDTTVLPGLIDCHTHLCFNASATVLESFLQRDDEELLDDMRARAQGFLSAGVTTIRDLGDRNYLAMRLAEETENAETAGPRILSAGAPVTPPGGHCHFLGGDVSGAEQIRALVRRNADAGAKVIKVMETGGRLTRNSGPSWESWETQFTPADLAVVVQAAHELGLPVAAHAHGAAGIADAVAAGVNTLEHCTWMTPGGDYEIRADVLADILAKDIVICPTITAGWRQVPKVFGEERAAKLFGNVQRMAEAGARMITGTDAGVQFAQPGGLAASLSFYEHIGVSKSRILQMATADAADALGLGGETGKLAAGYSADLLVVDGDPLEDLAALTAVKAVFGRGRRFQPGETK